LVVMKMLVRDDVVTAGAIAEVLEHPERLRPLFQPIVDLERGTVCGYEILARFPAAPHLSPDVWFAAARRHGLEGRLESVVVREALAARAVLAPGCFLSLNASPAALLSDEVREAFAEGGRLEPLVVEVTEQSDADLRALREALDELRDHGAQVAVDDAGSGYASLGRITALRPQVVKIDRALVSDLHVDPAKAAVVQALCELAGRIDAWVVAEGIERQEEVDALLRLRVPLGQGFAFGRPSPAMAEVDAALAELLGDRPVDPLDTDAVGALVEPVPTLPDRASRRALDTLFARRPRPEAVALVDREGRAAGLALRGEHARGLPPVRTLLVVGASMPIAAVARRAMARPLARRFDPVVCADGAGRLCGLVRVERLVDALARSAGA